ncbi:hypothetical protein BDW22DRAFT_1482423 [Trametopsis cervina]|nr:hypothetical protein BDW22DRAFT_1482423 [Trametopsis cervina]
MPKASGPPARQDSTPFKTNVQSLKRNQVGHLVWWGYSGIHTGSRPVTNAESASYDAKRPCSTCCRSHAYALAHASPADRLNLPDHPECTFDEVSAAPVPQTTTAAPKSRYERLENRINELESLLHDKSTGSSESSPGAGSSRPPSSEASEHSSLPTPTDFGPLPTHHQHNALAAPGHMDSGDWSKAYFSSQGPPENINILEFPGFSGPLDQLAGIASLIDSSPPADRASASTPASSSRDQSVMSPAIQGETAYAHRAETPNTDNSQGVVYGSWPAKLPDMTATRHLVQAFFTYYIHAGRMYHAPSFMASLDLHPSDPKFPPRAVLHAMCAIGSMYASPSPQNGGEEAYHYDPVLGVRFGKKRNPSFADQQAVYAKEAAEEGLIMGENIFEHSQTFMLLTWFYQSNARWMEACLFNAMSIRTTIPCGLNACPPFHGIAYADPFSDKPTNIIPNARTVLEDEVRRNTFWVAYAMERQLGAGNSWAMLMDDKDVAQLFPLRQDQFQQGVLVLPPDRQWSHAPDALHVHHPDQTDSFIMYIKASMLFSKVKNFNIRFKSLAYSGDASVTPMLDINNNDGLLKYSPRTTPLFLELDNLVLTFKNKFPAHLKNPVVNGKVDYYLYSAWNILHITQIHLHEPYARPGSESCLFAFKILTAARAIVDLLHDISSSSFDISLLDIYPFLCWFMAGRVLVRFLKSAQEAQAQDQILSLKTEVEFLRTMLLRAGERVPLAATYARMLLNMMISTCGDLSEETPAPPPPVPVEQPKHGLYGTTFTFKVPPEPPMLTPEEMVILSEHSIGLSHG